MQRGKRGERKRGSTASEIPARQQRANRVRCVSRLRLSHILLAAVVVAAVRLATLCALIWKICFRFWNVPHNRGKKESRGGGGCRHGVFVCGARFAWHLNRSARKRGKRRRAVGSAQLSSRGCERGWGALQKSTQQLTRYNTSRTGWQQDRNGSQHFVNGSDTKHG